MVSLIENAPTLSVDFGFKCHAIPFNGYLITVSYGRTNKRNNISLLLVVDKNDQETERIGKLIRVF